MALFDNQTAQLANQRITHAVEAQYKVMRQDFGSLKATIAKRGMCLDDSVSIAQAQKLISESSEVAARAAWSALKEVMESVDIVSGQLK